MDKLQQTWGDILTISGRKRHEHFAPRPPSPSTFVPINIVSLNVLIEDKVDTALRTSTWRNKLLIRDEAIGLLTEIKDQLYEIKKNLNLYELPQKRF